MGIKQSSGKVFSLEKLKYYETCTFFKRDEIQNLWKIFNELGAQSPNSKVSHQEILGLKQLRNNPFNRRILKIFSKKDSNTFSFDEFVDMCSAFNPKASLDIKSRVAFFLFDAESGDNVLTMGDITSSLSMMVNPEMMDNKKMIEVAKLLFKEVDIDANAEISLFEFQRLCSRVPEFKQKFSFKMV